MPDPPPKGETAVDAASISNVGEGSTPGAATEDGPTWSTQAIGDLIQVNGTRSDEKKGCRRTTWAHEALTSERNGHGVLRFDDDADLQLQELAGTYWHSAPRSLVAVRNRPRGEPKELARQALWWIRRVEQRFLYGYSWELLSDKENVLVRRLTVVLSPENNVSVCCYGGEDAPGTGSGTYDGKRFTLQMIDGELMHWSNMVRTKDMDKVLPGCTVSINQLMEMYPVSGAGNSASGNEVMGCQGSCPLAGAILSWLSGTPDDHGSSGN